MPGTTYLVSVELESKGNFGSKVADLKSSTSALGGVASTVGEAFTSAVDKAGELAMHLGMVGAAAGIAAVTYGVVGLNQELENTGIALGAIFSAQGFTKNFQEGVGLAADTISKMKQDVKSLPGDLGQLAGIFKTIATPGAQAGANVDMLRKIAGQTMIVGGVMGLDTATVSREMAMLLSGRAGAHNILGARMGFIGDAAKQFNALDPSARLQKIEAELLKYQPAIDAYGRSFVGMWTTLKDNIKYQFLTPATTPLFEGVKRSLSDINGWFDRNQMQVSTWAEAIGTKLGAAWEWGTAKAKEWGPIVFEFAETAYDRLVAMWDKVEPYAVRFAGWMKDALSDPNGTLDKIGYVLEAYAALKVGGGLLEGLGGVGGIGKAAGGAMGALGWLGAAGSTEVALAGLGASASQAGLQMAAWGAAALPVIGMLAAVTAAGYALYNVWDQGKKLYSEITNDDRNDSMARVEAGDRLGRAMGDAAAATDDYQRYFAALMEKGDYAAASLMGLREAADSAALVLGSMHVARNKEDEDRLAGFADEALNKMTAATTGKAMEHMAPSKHPGGAGVNIAKIEIQVTSNAEPSRVARLVKDEIVNLRRHSRSSPDVPNWSGAR